MRIWSNLSFILLFLAFFQLQSIQCQQEAGTVEGILLDASTQRPLRGVDVRLIGSDIQTKTDIKGRFSLTVPEGEYAGMVVEALDGAGLSLIEAQVTVEAGVIDNLEEIDVTSPSTLRAPSGSLSPSSPSAPVDSAEPSSSPSSPQTDFIPWLGILPQEIPADYGPQGGSSVAVIVGRVFRGSPAAVVGIQEGDFIDSVNGELVTSAYQLFQLIARSALEAPVEVTINRRGESLRMTPWLVPVPEAALIAIQDLSMEGFSPPEGAPPSGGAQGPPSVGSGPAPPHPLVQEARRQTQRGNFQAANRAYEEYVMENPQDGLVWAEYAEMVFHNIQQARGMQLMAQAVKKPGLPPPEKTRLRLIIAQRRLESGNLVTAKQMLLEAKREDPFDPIIDELLTAIEVIMLQASGQAPAPPGQVPFNQPGVQVDVNQVLLNELMGKIAEELAED